MANRHVQGDIHNSYPFQLSDPIIQVFTHSSNLTVQALSENDLEFKLTEPFDFTLARYGVKNRDAISHFFNKLFGDWSVDRDHIFLFMVISGPENFVNDITVIRQEDQAFTLFV